MMKCRLFTVKMETVNAAFTDCPQGEIARILRDVAERIERDGDNPPFYLRDINGNRVGVVTTKPPKVKR